MREITIELTQENKQEVIKLLNSIPKEERAMFENWGEQVKKVNEYNIYTNEIPYVNRAIQQYNNGEISGERLKQTITNLKSYEGKYHNEFQSTIEELDNNTRLSEETENILKRLEAM